MNKDWKKEFEKIEFRTSRWKEFTDKDMLDYGEKIKKFIQDLLHQQQEEMVKEIEKASEQISGGGNGRRILIQLLTTPKSKNKE